MSEQDKIVKKKENIESTEKYIPISEIRGDTVILKDGGLRGVIKVQGINLDLKSYDEQKIVVEQYKRFLNGIDFPFQIMIRSTYLDLTDYINYMKGTVEKIENDVLKWQGEKYTEFLNKLNESQGLLYTKEFYIAVPYYSMDDKKYVRKGFMEKFLSILSKTETPEKIVANLRFYQKNKKQLDSRCQIIMDKLREIGIPSERVNTKNLLSLLFETFNPIAHRKQSETVK